MIKQIHSSTNHIQISTGYSSVPPISPGSQSAGMLRWNTSSNCIEVYNGIGWYSIETSANIFLGHDAQQAIDWAVKKMQEENQLKSLMEKHPGLRDLNDKFEMMRVLCQEEENKQ